MPTKNNVKGDKFWRSLALICLCALVYYFSYDHGRKDMRREMEKLRQTAISAAEEQRGEILRLSQALEQCGNRENTTSDDWERFPLKAGQSNIIFGGRLVVTVLKVENVENMASVQLNFIDEGRLETKDMGAGTSFDFTLGGENWTLVLSLMAQSSVNFTLIKKEPEPTQ